jgi:hypothetical protein
LEGVAGREGGREEAGREGGREEGGREEGGGREAGRDRGREERDRFFFLERFFSPRRPAVFNVGRRRSW